MTIDAARTTRRYSGYRNVTICPFALIAVMIGRRYRAVKPGRDRELVGLAAPNRQHQVGGDDRDANGDQRLPEFIAGQALEDQDLKQRSNDAQWQARPR